MRLQVTGVPAWPSMVADVWVDRLREDPSLRMCLASGSTPVPVYAEMRRRVAAGEVSFATSTVFGLDEWLGLPPGHPVRCDAMLRRDLLDGIDLADDRLHLFDVDGLGPREACDDLDRRMDAAGGLDLAVVGLGGNGHVGMNEPGSSFRSPTRFVELADTTRRGAHRYGALETPPSHGVTVGLGPLLAATEIWLLVSGEAKAGILARVLDGPVGTGVPATGLRDHPGAVVLADEAAASRIDPSG